MELAGEIVVTRLKEVMSALSEKIGVEELVTFVIGREIIVTPIGENNPWFPVLSKMKKDGVNCLRVFNDAINSHMVIVVGQVTEDHVRSCPICSVA